MVSKINFLFIPLKNLFIIFLKIYEKLLTLASSNILSNFAGSGAGFGKSESPNTIFTKQYSIRAINTNLQQNNTNNILNNWFRQKIRIGNRGRIGIN